jgi:peptide/nickel transport system permease protein
MIAEGQPYLFTASWLVAVPGAAIFLSMLAVSMLGDGLRDALDPTLERRGLRAMVRSR